MVTKVKGSSAEEGPYGSRKCPCGNLCFYASVTESRDVLKDNICSNNSSTDSLYAFEERTLEGLIGDEALLSERFQRP